METLTYDTVYALNIDVQNQYLPDGRLAVENADAVIEHLNAINHWTRAQTAPDRNWPNQTEQLGEVILTRDGDDKKAGTAFPDNFDISCANTFAIDGANWITASYQDRENWIAYRAEHLSAWYAGMVSGSKFLNRSDGRSRGTETIKDMVLNGMNINEYDHQQKPQLRAALIIGGIAVDERVERTVSDALETVTAIQERLAKDHSEGWQKGSWQGDERIYGPEPLARPLGIFVVSDALKITDELTTRLTIERLRSFGALIVTATDIVTGNAIKMRS